LDLDGNFLDLDLDLDGNGNSDFLDLDLNFGNNGNGSSLLLSENGILVFDTSFMNVTVALVVSTRAGPFASTSGDGAHGNRTT
jgi:hypothetical protein